MLQFGPASGVSALAYQMFWFLAPTKLTRMVARTFDDDSTPLTKLMLGCMMPPLTNRAVIIAAFIGSARMPQVHPRARANNPPHFPPHPSPHLPQVPRPPPRGYDKCPICKQPHLNFRLYASLVSRTLIVPTPLHSLPTQRQPSRRPFRHLLLKNNRLYMLPNPFDLNTIALNLLVYQRTRFWKLSSFLIMRPFCVSLLPIVASFACMTTSDRRTYTSRRCCEPQGWSPVSYFQNHCTFWAHCT